MKNTKLIYLLVVLFILFFITGPAMADDLILTGTLSGKYFSPEGIITQGTCIIESGTSVEFLAGTRIVLNRGFIVESGRAVSGLIISFADSDNDGLDDDWENAQCGTLQWDKLSDPDTDGLLHYDEYLIGTGACDPDSDDDGLLDGTEVYYSGCALDPLNPDSDGDGLTDGQEVNQYLTDPCSVDSDNDGLTDYEEVMQYQTDPNNSDTDGDGMSDYKEIHQYGTDPVTFNVFRIYEYDNNGNLIRSEKP